MTWAWLGSMPMAVRIGLRKKRTMRRCHRPDHRADAAGEGDATEHDGGHAVEGGVGAQLKRGSPLTGDGDGGQPGEGGEGPPTA